MNQLCYCPHELRVAPSKSVHMGFMWPYIIIYLQMDCYCPHELRVAHSKSVHMSYMWPYIIIFTNESTLLLSTRITGGSFKKCTHGLHVTLHNYLYKWINYNLTFLPPLLLNTLSYGRHTNQNFKLELISPNVHIS